MIRFNLRAFFISILLFIVLVVIALYVRDRFVRPFVGDTLAVIWLYYTFKSFLNVSTYRLSICVLLIAYGVELAQLLDVVTLLGLEKVKLLTIILGATFDLNDLIAYTLGWLSILILNRFKYFNS